MFILKLSQSLSILIIVLNLSLILGFAFSISLILSFSAFVLHLIALDIFLEDSNDTNGIIIFDDVHVFSGPFKGESTRLFTLNEGTKV